MGSRPAILLLCRDFFRRCHIETGSRTHALSLTTCVTRLPEREAYHPRLSIVKVKGECDTFSDPSPGQCGVVIQQEGKRFFIRAHIFYYLEKFGTQ
jgi:hypothetical protein